MQKTRPMIRLEYSPHGLFSESERDLMQEHLRCWNVETGDLRQKRINDKWVKWTDEERYIVAELYERARRHGVYPSISSGKLTLLQAVNPKGRDEQFNPGWIPISTADPESISKRSLKEAIERLNRQLSSEIREPGQEG